MIGLLGSRLIQPHSQYGWTRCGFGRSEERSARHVIINVSAAEDQPVHVSGYANLTLKVWSGEMQRVRL